MSFSSPHALETSIVGVIEHLMVDFGVVCVEVFTRISCMVKILGIREHAFLKLARIPFTCTLLVCKFLRNENQSKFG